MGNGSTQDGARTENILALAEVIRQACKGSPEGIVFGSVMLFREHMGAKKRVIRNTKCKMLLILIQKFKEQASTLFYVVCE